MAETPLPLSPLVVEYRALRALELASWGSPVWAAQQVRDELLELERGDLLRVASVIAAEAQLRLTPVDQMLARRRVLQATLLEVTWRLS